MQTRATAMPPLPAHSGDAVMELKGVVILADTVEEVAAEADAAGSASAESSGADQPGPLSARGCGMRDLLGEGASAAAAAPAAVLPGPGAPPVPPAQGAQRAGSVASLESYMQDVKRRIERVQEANWKDYFPENRGRSSARRPTRPKGDHLSQFALTDTPGDIYGRRRGCRRFLVSFRAAVLGAITTAVLLASAGMSVLVELFTKKFRENEMTGCAYRVKVRRDLIDELAYDTVTRQQYKRRLRSVAASVEEFVVIPAGRAVEAIWGSMATQHHADRTWLGKAPAERAELSYRAWVELSRPWAPGSRCGGGFGAAACGPRVVALFALFGSGQYAGFSVQCAASSTPGTCESLSALLWDGPQAAANESSLLSVWSADWATGAPADLLGTSPWSPSFNPAYVAQEALAAAESGATAARTRVWSRAHRLAGSDEAGLTWTAPIMYCGRYSCLSGAVGATIRLRDVSYYCWRLWADLRDSLDTLADGTSGIFIVSQSAELFPDEQGRLLASSGLEGPDRLRHASELPLANESSQAIVRLASRALLEKFGHWDNPALLEQEVNVTGSGEYESSDDGVRLFSFSRRALEASPSTLAPCEAPAPGRDPLSGEDCYRVGALSLNVDRRTRWLAVLVLPARAFGAKAVATGQHVDTVMERLDWRLGMVVLRTRGVAVAVLLVAVVGSLAAGLSLGALIAPPLHRLRLLMRRLGDLDFARDSEEFAELRPGRRSRIRDVRELQEAFRRLSAGTEAFSHFVPETVVRNIIHGDPNATKLHVARREVTIMNSDIEGFTAMSESLSQRDLLFVLTRYLSVMTRVVESYDAVVSEIQGDGLIVFWNTPNDVDDHGSKACAASLAQQHAVGLLSYEFSTLNLPHLMVRIGIHTGWVMSGNIGSERKMKFGCLGEPMKIAGCLQELCKPYGVQVICSADTYLSVEDGSGFKCRRLDLINVKHSGEATWIYEVLGRDADIDDCSPTPEVHLDEEASGVAAPAVGLGDKAGGQSALP